MSSERCCHDQNQNRKSAAVKPALLPQDEAGGNELHASLLVWQRPAAREEVGKAVSQMAGQTYHLLTLGADVV